MSGGGSFSSGEGVQQEPEPAGERWRFNPPPDIRTVFDLLAGADPSLDGGGLFYDLYSLGDFPRDTKGFSIYGKPRNLCRTQTFLNADGTFVAGNSDDVVFDFNSNAVQMPSRVIDQIEATSLRAFSQMQPYYQIQLTGASSVGTTRALLFSSSYHHEGKLIMVKTSGGALYTKRRELCVPFVRWILLILCILSAGLGAVAIWAESASNTCCVPPPCVPAFRAAFKNTGGSGGTAVSNKAIPSDGG
jgi:hypothetical protein